MAAPTKFVVFLAFLSVVSSSPFDFFEKIYGEPKCSVEVLGKDSSDFDGPPMVVDWNQRFIDHEIFRGESLEKVNSNPLLVKELLVNVQNNVEEYSLTADKTVRCAAILADKILESTIKGKHISGLDIKGGKEIRGLTLQGKNIYNVKLACVGTRESHDSSMECNIWRSSISGKTVEKVLAMGINFTENTINAAYLYSFKVMAKTVSRNKFSAKDGIYHIMINAEAIADTQIESFHIDGAEIEATELRNLRINGTKLNDVTLKGESSASFINNIYMEGDSLKKIEIMGKTTTDNVVIKAKNLEEVVIGASDALRNVDVTATDNIENLIIGSESSNLANIKLNGVSVELEGNARLMQCSNKLGYPEDDDELAGVKKCFSGYCKSMCSANGQGAGKCFGQTCCCMRY